MASTVAMLIVHVLQASELSVTVLDAQGAALSGAVIVAEPDHAAAAARAGTLHATLDQRDLQFVPEVLVVRTGTLIDFPNSDQVRHQVYSFSKPKSFQLALYAGHAYPPILFDKPGLVTVGCNIHDRMVGYIYVTDSPWFARSDAKGQVTLRELPEGRYTLHVWHSRLDEDSTELTQPLVLGATPTDTTVRLRHALKPALHHHGMDSKWADY